MPPMNRTLNVDAIFKLDLINHKQDLWTLRQGGNWMIIPFMDVLVVGNEVHSTYHMSKRFIYWGKELEATLDHCSPSPPPHSLAFFVFHLISHVFPFM